MVLSPELVVTAMWEAASVDLEVKSALTKT